MILNVDNLFVHIDTPEQILRQIIFQKIKIEVQNNTPNKLKMSLTLKSTSNTQSTKVKASNKNYLTGKKDTVQWVNIDK